MENSAVQLFITSARERLEELVRQRIVPGLSFAVFQKDTFNWQEGFGYSNIDDKIQVNPVVTRFRAASVSKPITACALATMVAEDMIDLDSSFYEYVPYFPKKQYDFNIRQLAAHTAGIRGYRGKEYALNRPYGIRDSLVVFQNDSLLFKPGSQFHYNSYGYVLLSLAMQEASGIPFDVYTREKVLVPLGMSNTLPEQPNTNNDQQAKFYTRWTAGFRIATEVDHRFKLAGGGYLTTVEDMVKLSRAILDKSFYPDIMSEILKAQIAGRNNTYYGLGWEVSEDLQGRPFYGHIGNQIGGYSYFRIFPGTGLIIAALVNCSDPDIRNILDEILEEIHPICI